MMTLRTIEQYTPLEIIDYVDDFLAKQGCKGFDKVRQVCAYRTPDGNKCAIGAIMSDEEYLTVHNAAASSNSVDYMFAIFNITDKQIRNLLWAIQKIHDDYQPRLWRTKFAELRMQYA